MAEKMKDFVTKECWMYGDIREFPKMPETLHMANCVFESSSSSSSINLVPFPTPLCSNAVSTSFCSNNDSVIDLQPNKPMTWEEEKNNMIRNHIETIKKMRDRNEKSEEEWYRYCKTIQNLCAGLGFVSVVALLVIIWLAANSFS